MPERVGRTPITYSSARITHSPPSSPERIAGRYSGGLRSSLASWHCCFSVAKFCSTQLPDTAPLAALDHSTAICEQLRAIPEGAVVSISQPFAVTLSVAPRPMSKRIFTPKAEALWSIVPNWARERILANVFCTRCRTSVQMVDYTGTEKNGDVILEGQCAVCGHKVARVVETSEAPPPNN